MACPKSVKPGTKHKKGPFHRIGGGILTNPTPTIDKEPKKEAPEDIFRRLFSKIFMVIMTNKQDLFHNIFKYFTICS